MSWRVFLLFLILISSVSFPAVAADTWVVFSLSEWDEPEGVYRDITFTFDGSTLSLNTPTINTAGGSSMEAWDLVFAGKWAVMGTVDSNGDLIADPYASFVYDGYGGHVNWVPNTPSGYIAPLLLGHSFNGDGAQTYLSTIYEEQISSTTGTIVLWDHLPRRPDEMNFYSAKSHTFYADSSVNLVTAPVPEPSSLVALLCGLSGLGSYVVRKRRKNIYVEPVA